VYIRDTQSMDPRLRARQTTRISITLFCELELLLDHFNSCANIHLHNLGKIRIVSARQVFLANAWETLALFQIQVIILVLSFVFRQNVLDV
jgi:hypothetical protein